MVFILQSGEVLSAQLSLDLKLLSLVVESVRENGQQVDVLNISVSCRSCMFSWKSYATGNILREDT